MLGLIKRNFIYLTEKAFVNTIARKSDYRYLTMPELCTHSRISPSKTGLQLSTGTTRDLDHIDIGSVPNFKYSQVSSMVA